MKLGTNSTTRLNVFTNASTLRSTMQNLFSYVRVIEFDFRMEQKMSPILTTFILLFFPSVTVAGNNIGIPYDDCKWFECVGMKGNKRDCITTKDCDILLIRSADYSQSDPLVVHQLYWIGERTTNDFPYAAVGYSKDKEIGDDAVTACSYRNDYKFITALSKNGRVELSLEEKTSVLYATKSTGLNVCAWTTQLAFTKSKPGNLGEEDIQIDFDLSKGEYILLGKGVTDSQSIILSISLHLVSDETFKFDPIECNPQAYVFKKFYCWILGDTGNRWNLSATVDVKEEATQFELTFRNTDLGNSGTILMGLSLHPLSKSISLVKCNWNQETVSLQDAFQSGENVQDLEAKPPITYTQGHKGNEYLKCIWIRSSNSWTYNLEQFDTSKNLFYISMQSNKINNNAPKFTDWPLVFPDFTDDELGDCGGNCVGMRDANETDNKCVGNNTCIITLVVKLSEEKYLFSIRSALTFGVWTSVTLSAEESSNEKLGFDCAIKGEVDAKPSGEVTTTTNKDEKGSKAVKILDAKLTVDGPRRMTCEFEVEKPITFPGGEKGTTLDLERNEAFITIAFGRFSGQKEKARQSVSLKTSFKFNDDGQAERTFLVILSLTCVALFVVSTLSVIGLGLYLYHPKKRKGVKVKKGAKRKSLKIKSRKSSPVGSKIDKGSPTSNI